VNCKGLKGKTALHIIVEDEESYPGFLEVLLQQKNLDFESLDDKGHTPLISALTSSKGRKGASRLLQLPPGVVNITATDRNGTNALALASFRGWTEARRVLRARDKSQVYAFGLDGMNVLTRAAYFGQRRLLEDHLQDASSEDVRRFANAGRFNLANLCARQDWEDLVDNLRNRYGVESQEQDDNGRTILHLAALNGWSYGCFSHSEKQKALLNVQDFDGHTPLHLAAASRNFASAEFLLREGASILIKDKEGKTAVHTAAEAGSRAILEHFLDSKVLEFGRDNAGRGLLHFISMWEWPPILQKYCRTRKVIINIKDRKHQTALHIAAIFGNTQIVGLLLDYGADQTKQDHIGFTPLYHAIQQGHHQVKDLLLAKSADWGLLDGFRRSALSIAPSAQNHTQATSPSGQRTEAQPSTKIKSSGSFAIPRNYPNALLTYGDLSYSSKQRVRSPVRKDCFDDMAAELSMKARMVLPANIDCVEPCGWTLLHKVVAFCSPEIVDVVLSAGSDPNKPNTFTGVTALHIAAYGNIYRGELEEFQQKIRRLLDAGASIDVMDSTSCTPVEAACVGGNFEAFELLLSRGADPNIQDANGKSVLHRAVERQQVKAVIMLMGRADIHQKDHHGKTPLMAAFVADKPRYWKGLEGWESSDKVVIISTLLSHGADPMVEDSEGVNVLIPATSFGRGRSVVKTLTAAFAWPTSNQLSRRGLSLLIQNWQMGYDDISSRFLAAGGQPMDPSASLCCYSGDRRILKALLEWKPNLSREYIVRSVDRPVTPLHYAARWLATEHVRLLLRHGADVNQLNSFEETPLMHAADSTFNPEERERVVRLLLESGADVSIIASTGYRKGWTAVEFSANRGNQSVSKVLRDALHGVHSKPHLEAVNSVPSGKAFVQDELEYGSYFHDADEYLWDYKGLRLTSKR
jgi:ankyrin repeat protein